jgi:O-antigen ligase
LFFHVQQDPLSKRVRPILTALGVGFTIASVIGIWQIIDTLDLPLGWRLRAQAFVHPATYGEQMCVGLLGAVSFLFFPPPGKDQKKARTVAIFLAFATGLALLLSNTRGALASCIIAFLAMGFLVPAVRRYFFWIFAAAVLGLIAMESFRTDRSLLVTVMKWNTKASHQGQFMRLHLWDAAWRIGQDHIWTGVGHNNFRIIFPQYARLLMEDGTFTWGTAHNLYLHHFAERGLLGLSAVLCVLASFWKRAFDRVRENPDGFNLWAFGTTTSFIFMNMTEVAFQVEILWMLVFFVWIWAETRHTFFQRKKNND